MQAPPLQDPQRSLRTRQRTRNKTTPTGRRRLEPAVYREQST